MPEQRAVARAARLHLGNGALPALVARLVRLRLDRRLRIEPPEILDRDGGLFRVRPVERGIEIDQPRLLVLKLGDEVAHLQAPVAEVHVRDHRIAEEAQEALQRIADHRRAQVADMHGLGDVRAAEIDHGDLTVRRELAAGHRIAAHRLGPRRERRVRDPQIDEARPRHIRRQHEGMCLQCLGNLARNLARVASGRLRRRHCAVALEIREFRLVAAAHLAVPRLKAHGFERGARGGR